MLKMLENNSAVGKLIFYHGKYHFLSNPDQAFSEDFTVTPLPPRQPSQLVFREFSEIFGPLTEGTGNEIIQYGGRHCTQNFILLSG